MIVIYRKICFSDDQHQILVILIVLQYDQIKIRVLPLFADHDVSALFFMVRLDLFPHVIHLCIDHGLPSISAALTRQL